MIDPLPVALCSSGSAHEQAVLALCTLLPEGVIPEWVHLMPNGRIDAADGRRWVNDNPQAVIDASMSSIDLVIDYDHQTDHVRDNGAKAPAAGWIKAMELRDDGIWGRVEWTEAAIGHLRRKEYRYLSPTFIHDKKQGRVSRILRAALVNDPAIHDLTALARKSPTHHDKEQSVMEELLKALAKALGLKEGTTKEDVLAKIEEVVLAGQSATDMVTAMCKALGVEDDPTAEALETALASRIEAASGKSGGNPDPGEYVTMASYEELRDQMKAMQDGLTQSSASAAVDAAVEAGKITPAQKEWALAYAAQDPEAFEAFVEKQPVIVARDGTVAGRPEGGSGKLTADEVATCKTLGITEADFIKSRDGDDKDKEE